MKITILIDDKPAGEILHDDAVFAFSLAHRALQTAQEEAAHLVELVETAPAPAASDPTPPAADPAVS